MAVQPDIRDTEEELQGGSTKRDLEKMFQLLYLTFTAPRADPEAFAVFTSQLKILAANQEAQPEVAFQTALAAALTQDNVRARPLTPALVDRMNLNKSLAFYKDRFADASDFTFVFVGASTCRRSGRSSSGTSPRFPQSTGRKPPATSAFSRRPGSSRNT
jgi:zinc protease